VFSVLSPEYKAGLYVPLSPSPSFLIKGFKGRTEKPLSAIYNEPPTSSTPLPIKSPGGFSRRGRSN
ncbi:MAG: hypothetical protein AAB725_01740, partial [Patescibacteria group bacterium]